jgi:hypothetical protein
MSQMTNAVSRGSQVTAFVDGSPDFDRERSCSFKESEPPPPLDPAHPERTRDARSMRLIVIMYRE